MCTQISLNLMLQMLVCLRVRAVLCLQQTVRARALQSRGQRLSSVYEDKTQVRSNIIAIFALAKSVICLFSIFFLLAFPTLKTTKRSERVKQSLPSMRDRRIDKAEV